MHLIVSALLMGLVGLTGRESLRASIASIASSADEVTWITWTVPAVPAARLGCCNRSGWVRGRHAGSGRAIRSTPCLVDDQHSFGMSDDSDPVDRIVILVRVESRRISRVRVERDDCPLEFGPAKVVALSEVSPAESVAWLEQQIRDGGGRHGHHGDVTLAALALHADPAADRALERLVRPGNPSEHRRGAAFWLAASRGRHGYDVIRALSNDEDESFREHLTFALHVSAEAAAVDDLIGLARNDRAPGVRRQALFWIAQRAGEAAVGMLKTAIDEDPDADVRQHAVFAVSQLPPDRSVPLLIELSRTHRSPEVRRQAFFWLGQVDDPRALAFFEEILSRR